MQTHRSPISGAFRIKIDRVLAVCFLAGLAGVARAQQWQTPTPEELSMTAQPEVPGAAAVYLYREQTTDDKNRMFSYYVRLKVLSDGGKDLANVEIPFVANQIHQHIDSVAGRTIHPDGTVIAFTGKPYEKLDAKAGSIKEKSMVFTLPAVEVGSILEYRFKLRYDDAYFQSPDWYIQSELFTRRAHYVWWPTQKLVSSGKNGDILDRISYTQILPPGSKGVEKKDLMTGGMELSLDVSNVMPLPHEELMPPIGSVSYRVLFYYTAYKDGAEFWHKEGQEWSKANDKFIGPGPGVKAFVAQTVAPTDSEQVKAKKLYDAVMTMENTDFTREHSADEDKAQGLRQINTTDDILLRKRGSSDQLADLYVAMARAAGLKSYVVAVADRSRRLFQPAYLSLRQFDDDLAVVVFDGKEHLVDPGSRYCAFGQLAWKHTATGAIRQTDSGTALVVIPEDTYRSEHSSRIADLKLDDHGEATGTVTMTYEGNAALSWRHAALRGDDTSLNHELRTSMEHRLPGGMQVRVTDVQNLTDPDKPLIVKYEVKGAIGTPTGKRLLISGQLFEANEKPLFPSTGKRELDVAMHYPIYTQDAVRITYPTSLKIESSPAPQSSRFLSNALFTTSTKQGPNSITLFRNVEVAKAIFHPEDYPELRGFYTKLESNDGEPLVLIRADAAASTPKQTAAAN